MPTILTTPRVTLRHLEPSDLNHLFQMNSDPRVMEYIAPVYNLETCQKRLEMALAFYQEHPQMGKLAAIQRSDNAFMGWFCLQPLDNTEEFEIGYRMMPEFWGKGIATEAAKVLLDYGFEQVGLKRIVGITRPDNIASQRVLLKIGLVYEEQRHYYNTDVNYYALNRDDWSGS